MATVHLGRLRGPAGFARTVAIKRLHPPFARDPEFVSMFLDEARLAARIRHPNVVSVLDVVAAERELFLVMDYIHGESLNHLMQLASKQRIAMPRRVLASILVGVLSGLDAAHEARNELGVPLEIVHRDVSPQNVLLGLDGIPMVLDFGLAKASLRVHWSAQSGQLKGKIGYMSPEQLTTGLVDRRADIYSAGVMLWEGLTGRRMFNPKAMPSEEAIAGRIAAGQVEPPSAIVPSTPKALDEVVLKALSPARADRFQTAREMAEAIERALPPAANRQVGDWVDQVAGAALRERAIAVSEVERVELTAPDGSSDFPMRPQTQAEAEAEESPPSDGKALPPPPPVPRPAARPVEEVHPVLSSKETVIGYAVMSVDAASPRPAEPAPVSASPRPADRPVVALGGLGAGKQTIVGMPVPLSERSPEAPTAEVASAPVPSSEPRSSDPPAMLVAPLLSPQRRRALVIGGVASLGLVTGFVVVSSLAAPAPRAKGANPGVVAPVTVAPEPPPVPESQAGEPPVVTTAPAAEAPSAALPAGTPAGASRSTSASKPAPAKPAAPVTPVAAKPSATPAAPPPAAPPPAATCNPPYRLDFFGNKVPKPGCS